MDSYSISEELITNLALLKTEYKLSFQTAYSVQELFPSYAAQSNYYNFIYINIHRLTDIFVFESSNIKMILNLPLIIFINNRKRFKDKNILLKC